MIRIAERADVSVQTLYSNWGNKRNLLRAVMESSVTGDEDVPLVAGRPPAVITATIDPADAADPAQAAGPPEPPVPAARRAVGGRLADLPGRRRGRSGHRRGLAAAQRPAPGGVPCPLRPGARGALRAGLSNTAAADTAWVIASPDAHDLLVRQAGYSYDQLENWARSTLSAALLAGPERE